jgi:hypothetical protein
VEKKSGEPQGFLAAGDKYNQKHELTIQQEVPEMTEAPSEIVLITVKEARHRPDQDARQTTGK